MLSLGFMQRALAAGLLVGVAAPLIGVFLVTRRYAFMAETLAHVSLAGVAAGALLGIHPMLSALVATMMAAFSVERLRMLKKLQGEAALALFLSGGLAVSSVLLSRSRGVSLQGLLFGSITTVTPSDLAWVAVLAAVVLGTLALAGRALFAVSFDEELARAGGLPVTALNMLLAGLAALTVTVALPLVGGLLVGALMVIPAVSAMQWKASFRRTLGLSVLFSLLSVIVGLAASYRLGVPSGGSVVLACIACFLVSSVAGRR